MGDTIESALRGPRAFRLARQAIEEMERRGVWPTPLNFELWMHALVEPDGELALELRRMVEAGETVTDLKGEALAATHLPKARLNDQIRDAGDRLNRELASVAKAIKQAHQTNEQYGRTLDGAGRELAAQPEPGGMGKLVETLSRATRDAQQDNRTLEARLEESTAEVTRLRDRLEEVRRDATVDGLTNLANRRAFDDALVHAAAAARESRAPLALAVLDIDHFKVFNDTWGHQTGDQVLRYVASVIGRLAPAPRFAARYGGEEFAIIFPNERQTEVVATLEAIRLEVSSRSLKRRSTNEDLGAITLSAGLAELRPGEETVGLIERADEALYGSKHSGRNRVTLARPEVEAA